MQKEIEEIKKPIALEMSLFEDKFYSTMKTKVALLDRIMQYIVRRKGKQMRPIFVFLTAKLFTEEVSEKTYQAASLIELIHTASLVHDDVVDDSNMRRGFFSINALWKNKISVLVGDFLLSKSMIIAIENNNFDLLKIISKTIKKMAEGELLQIEKARRLDITEEVYFQIIEQKTAVLIAACCEAGTRSVMQDEGIARKMNMFGLYAGLAFQIKDDLFDYSSSGITGKPIGIDIKEKKMTLPLIHSMQMADKKTKKWMLSIVKNHNQDNAKVQELIAYIKTSGGLDYAKKTMLEYLQKAENILVEFPDNKAKKSLLLLLNFVIDREH